MKQTKRQTPQQFFIVLFFLTNPLFIIFSLIEIYVTENYNGVRTVDEFILTTWPWVIFALAFYFMLKGGLNFTEVAINYSDQDFQAN